MPTRSKSSSKRGGQKKSSRKASSLGIARTMKKVAKRGVKLLARATGTTKTAGRKTAKKRASSRKKK